MQWGHSRAAALERNCKCDSCIEDRRAYNRAKAHRRRKREPGWGRGLYTPISATCTICGGMVKRYHGHRYEQCWKCREAAARAARPQRPPQPKYYCGKCGKSMKNPKATPPICPDCRRVRVQAPCVECGDIIRTSISNPEPMCQSCKHPHGVYGWRRGCDCRTCHDAGIDVESEQANRPSRKAKADRRIAAKQAATESRATRSGSYSPYEDAVLMRDDMTTVRCAIVLGRTFHSAEMRRKRLRNPGAY